MKISSTLKCPQTRRYYKKHQLKTEGCTMRCINCGYPVLKSDLDDYPYQCIYCDEDKFSFEVKSSGKPITDIEKYNMLIMIDTEMGFDEIPVSIDCIEE